MRNKSDEAIQALAEKGGVIAICTWPPILFVGDKSPKIEDVYAHVKYVEDLVGIDYIGLATDVNERRQSPGDLVMEWQKISRNRLMVDYLKLPPPEKRATWPDYLPEGNGAEGFFDFTKVLVAGGYSDQEIEKILGGNLLRIFEKVWHE
jgi:membrane dipeptidase